MKNFTSSLLRNWRRGIKTPAFFLVLAVLACGPAQGQQIGVGIAPVLTGNQRGDAAGGGGVTQFSPYFRVKADDPANVIEQTDENFDPADVIVADDRIVLPDLDYEERGTWTIVGGSRVYFSSTGTLPSPLTADTPYYLIPHASGGYEIYPETSSGDYVNLPNMLVEETPMPAQNMAQKKNKINLTTQGTGTHRVFSNPLYLEMPNVVAGQDFAGKLVVPGSDRHKRFEQIIDENGRKALLARLLTRNPEMTGSYAISGMNMEFSGDRIPFQTHLREKRSVVVSAVLRWGETTTRGAAKTPILPAGVNTTTGVMTYVGDGNHQVITARKVKLRVFPGGTLPSGLSTATTYYGRSVTTTTITLHTSASDATNNVSPVIPTTQGTEGFTIVDYARPGDGERMRFVAEVRQPSTGGNTATVRSNSEGWGDGNIIMETDIVASGSANGRIGAIGRTVNGLVPTTQDIHEVTVWWTPGSTPPTISGGGAMTTGTYWMTRDPGGSIYARLHASLADAQASLGLNNADATCLKFSAAGEGYMNIRSNSGRPVSVSSERGGGALAPNFWSPNIGTTELLTWVVDYNNPDADVIQTWVYRNGILEAIAEGSGTKGLTDAGTNALDTGMTFLNSPQGHVAFEGYIYDFALMSSTEAIRPENLTSWHNSLLSEYNITPENFAPYAIFDPVITGDPINGETISVDVGTWAAYPAATFTYQWKNNGVDISGATSQTYTIQAGDVGDLITCAVTATNSEGISTETTDSVTGSPSASAPVNVVLPSISGPPVDGKTIIANPGTWDAVPQPSYQYQWIRNGVDISGETGSTFSPVTEEGNVITVRVTATNASGTDNATSGGVTILPFGSFTPPDNPNLAVWYDPSDLGSITSMSGAVSQINDKSGNSNHATQSTGSLKPTTGTRTIGGLNVLDFDNRTEEMIMPPATYGLGRDSSTVFVVGNFDTTSSAPGNPHFFRGWSQTGGARYFLGAASSSFNARAGQGSSLTTTHNTSDHIFALRRTGNTSFEFWIDGVLIGTRSGTSNTLIEEMILGKTHDGKLGETIFLGGAATDPEMVEIGNYLEDKWGLTWYAPQPPDQVGDLECVAQDGAANCLWFEPDDNDASITDYIVQYKLHSNSSWTTLSDGTSTDTAVNITGLSNGQEYDVQVAAVNSQGTGTYSATVSITPNGSPDGLEDVLTGVVAVWNANNYSGTGDWLNEVASPADGSAQSAYDLTPSGSFYTDGCFEFDGSHNFDIGTNTAFLNALGKTSAGGDWHWIALTETALASPQMTLLGTADVAADNGVVWRVDSGGAQKLDQYNGTAAVTQNGTATVTQNSRNIIATGYDRDSNLAKFALNSDTQVTKTANWTASTADATHSLKVGSEGNGGSMTSGWRLCGLALIDHDLSDSELAAANDWFDSEFPAAPPGVPDAPVSVIAMPSNGSVHLAWDLWNENGAAVTDYTIQRDCGSGYSTFSDGTSANKFATVTGLSNGTACNFRVSATNSAGTGSYSTPVSATPATEGTNPYDETDYKLTTPVNAQGNRTGSAAEITSTIGTYQSAWFGRVGDTFVFNCVYPGATTATATYARSELRGLYNGQQFNFDDDSDDTLDFAVTDCPTSAGNTKVIVQQIHDADEPIYKLNYDCKAGTGTDTIRALIKVGDGDALDCDWNRNGIKDSGESCPTLKTLSRGTRTKSRVVYDGDGSSHGGQQTIDFYIDDVLAFTTPLYRSGANDPMYTKRGNYCQLGPAGSKTTVVHYAP